MSRCKTCGAEIVWIQLESGKLTPCNPKGLTIVAEGRVIRGLESHFATCPQADEHRRPKDSARDDRSGPCACSETPS